MFEMRKKKTNQVNGASVQSDFCKKEWSSLSLYSGINANAMQLHGGDIQESLRSGKRDVRFIPDIVQLKPQKNDRNGVSVNTKLDEQYGPSCWLFVLDAIFQELGEEAPLQVAIGKFFYPSAEELKQAGGGRVKALEIAQNRIDTLIGRFAGITQNPRANQNLKKNTIIRMFHSLFQGRGGWKQAEAMVDYISDQDMIDVAVIIQRLETEKTALETLKTRLENVPKNQTDAEFILGTSKMNLGSNYGTIASLKLDLMDRDFSLPLYMSVNRRFSPNESGKFDFSNDTESKTKTRGAHAILITNLQYGSEILQYIIDKTSSENYYIHFSVTNDIWNEDSKFDDGFVEYKDPNYGNETIRILWSQFMEMSQKESGKDDTIFSFVSSERG